MALALKRVYDTPAPDDGYRILVDRLWPRGLTKEIACIDEWAKEIAPSAKLRVAVHSGDISWAIFVRSYRTELKACHEQLSTILKRAKRSRVTLVYGAKDPKQNHAQILLDYLQEMKKS